MSSELKFVSGNYAYLSTLANRALELSTSGKDPLDLFFMFFQNSTINSNSSKLEARLIAEIAADKDLVNLRKDQTYILRSLKFFRDNIDNPYIASITRFKKEDIGVYRSLYLVRVG